MPFKAYRACAVPGCSELIPTGKIYCARHTKDKNRQYEKTSRNKETKKLYNSERWQRLRQAKLAAFPLCERCSKPNRPVIATIVHHKEEVAEGGAMFPAIDKLESICRNCHEKAHKRGIIREKTR